MLASFAKGRTWQTTASCELALFIEGCDLVGRRVLSPGIINARIPLDNNATERGIRGPVVGPQPLRLQARQGAGSRSRYGVTFRPLMPRCLIARIGIALFCAGLPVTSCVCVPSGPRKKPPRDLALYDFAHPPDPPMLSLWPVGPKAPERKKRELLTRREGNSLRAITNGPGPFFIWEFQAPVRAGALSVEFESDAAAQLQLYWSDESCRTYNEQCSAKAQIVPGKQTVDFVLDPSQILYGLRLDLPRGRRVTLSFEHITLLARSRVSSGFAPRKDTTQVSTTPEGLRIISKQFDPWVTFSTPWLRADQVESVEATMHAAKGTRPELYWRGTECVNFSEKCHAWLLPVAGKPELFRAKLVAVPTWRGGVMALRFDPGVGAGDYLLHRLVIVRRRSKP